MENEQKLPINIEDEMRRSYLDYAMSVIIGRALPDVRDGLKPVHRRILYSMNEKGLVPGKPYKKSANVVGDVLGAYHPHGDSAVYDSMVRMAQDFSLRYPLIDGQGNWGSIDGDSAAAYRYTEARLTRIATEMLADIEKETVRFTPNYDESRQEPTVLPARIPNLLINGSDGIAVGMATKIPPHNLGEIIEATIHLIQHPQAKCADLLAMVPGPDFPTGGFIYGREGIRQAYETGRGVMQIRARAAIDKVGRGAQERDAIVITEIPFQVNKSKLIEQIADLVNEKKVDGISEIRDETDRESTAQKKVRIVIELKRDAMPQIILNKMKQYRFLRLIASVALVAIAWSSCADLDITKRRYRPGFHVSASGGKAQQKAEAKSHRADRSATAQTQTPAEDEVTTAQVDVDEEIFIAQQTNEPIAVTDKALRRQRNKEALREAMAPLTDPSAYTKMMRELRAEMRAGKFRKAVFNRPQEEKQGWSVPAIMALPFGAAAVIFAILTLVSVTTDIIFGGGITFIPFVIFGLLAFILGIVGMVMGVIGRKQYKDGKRGKGFALGGLISGILGMAFGLIFMIIGVIFTFINKNNN